MAYLLYKRYKNKKHRELAEDSEPSHPTSPSKPGEEPSLPTAPSKPGKSSKNRDCVHRRDASQVSSAALELTAYPSAAPTIPEKPQAADTSPCAACAAAKRAARRYRWRLIAGLFVPFFVQSLDVTIIAGALPFIASDFSKATPPSFCNL